MNNALSETTIRKKVRLDALQHPMTILPAALCGLSLIYLVLVSDILGGTRYVIMLLFCSTVIAAGSFLWRYTICYENTYPNKICNKFSLFDSWTFLNISVFADICFSGKLYHFFQFLRMT
jgi:hypothetical protein